MHNFETLLKGSAEAHGHLCPGQVVGVRMAMLGCLLIDLDDPNSHEQIKKLIVFVEMDRCTADAVAYVTGVKLGRRSLKFLDYGIMAATFVNIETENAFRIISTEEARSLVSVYAQESMENPGSKWKHTRGCRTVSSSVFKRYGLIYASMISPVQHFVRFPALAAAR